MYELSTPCTTNIVMLYIELKKKKKIERDTRAHR